MGKKNITQISKGLHTDNSNINVPKGTYQYALNAVNETERGDLGFIGNEESNEPCASLTPGYTPIGKVYIGGNKTVIFSVDNNGSSEIGVVDNNCNYEVHVNDSLQLDLRKKLGFKITHQIDATFRLRRGCETTIYFVDGHNNKPMYYILEKPELFKTDGVWDKSKFELQRSYSKIPIFQGIKVLNNGGQLEAGSYNIGVQYLDANLNATEWITTSEIIYVYNDDTDEDFLKIGGAINIETGADTEDYRDFPTTDKAIRVELSNLDETFLFYRLVFIGATTGNGLVNTINYTSVIPIGNPIFTYTGTNFETKGTEEDIITFNETISSAGSIEQVENRLLLGNVKGKQINFCKLQKYASKIKTDMRLKKILLNEISEGNTKSPTVNFEATGYMPGEIYSFGIVYVFEDGSLTPTYHIPGKSNTILDTEGNNITENFVFSSDGVDNENISVVQPMALDNQSNNTKYLDNNTCSAGDYWGVDSQGEELKGTPVRHHRFPLRSKLGLDFIKIENTIGETITYNQVVLNIEGDLLLPCSQEDMDAGVCSSLQTSEPFQIQVTYEVDGVTNTMVININPMEYQNGETTYELIESKRSDYIVEGNTITIISIEESLTDVSPPPIIGVETAIGSPEHGSLSYSVGIEEANSETEKNIYSAKVFGIQFSGVEMPDLSCTNGDKIIGYYIVRQERTEEEKTILDSAILTPTIINKKYIAHGLLGPEISQDKVSKTVFGMIHPEHKFRGRKYSEFTEMIQEGSFNIIKKNKSKFRYLDVTDGSSYDKDVHKWDSAMKQHDGWSLKAITRDNILNFNKKYNNFNASQNDIEDVFYLDALESRNIEEETKTVYNIAGDNKVGIIQLKKDSEESMLNSLPYMYLKRPVMDSYPTFRTTPYYKTSINMETFDDDTTVVFAGDTFITPMRYVNTMWWDNAMALRSGQTSAWNYIAGGILVAVGVVLSIVYGAGIPLVIAGLALFAAGTGVLLINAGIKRDALVKAYYEEYDKGLRETLLDDWVKQQYVDYENRASGPMDDEIQWVADATTDMWFESQINMSLRYGMTSGAPTFMSSPGIIEEGNTTPEVVKEYFKKYTFRDDTIPPSSVLDRQIADKLLVFNADRIDAKWYIGHTLGEWYKVNPDYFRVNKQKVFHHLGLEYDCCSDCQEDFPHRVNYSEQSFQEELTDNFRVFLPNNYRDIEGETGAITDLFRIKNNLYIHTEEALWHQPQNFQERVTGDIVSFLGTGGYFSVPPRKILDDNKASGGTKHREATIKTKHGVFFVSENENKFYKFDGNQLEAISDLGMNNWFKENTKIQLLKDYYEANGNEYPYDDNPSNPFGVGFISVYDTKKERIIFTKKDTILSNTITDNQDFEICSTNGNLIMFENFQQTIDTYITNGWSYVGLEDCRMKFEKTGFNTEIQIGEVTTTVVIPPDTIVIPFFDTTSMTDSTITNISATLNAWFPGFKNSVNGGVNNMTLLNPGNWNHWGTERWLRDPVILALNNTPPNSDVLLLTFVDEVNNAYHGRNLSSPMTTPSTTYNNDITNFTNTLYPLFNNFIAINYPIVRNSNECKEYLQHTIGAIEGKNLTQIEVDALQQNNNFSAGEWNILKNNLQNNPYASLNSLKDYGWLYKENRIDGINNNLTTECSQTGFVISPCQFTLDIQEVLTTQTTTIVTETEIEIQAPFVEVAYVEGVIVDNFAKADNSWTMSFSLKAKSWTSWHSYLPNFYYYIAEKFYSWGFDKISIIGNTFWRHNKKGHYQNFYGEGKSFSVEYIAMSEAMKTKIWDDITLHTEAKRYNESMKQYVDVKDVTFNKGVFYNSRQCSGLLNFKVKGSDAPEDYMTQQVVNVDPGTIIIDRNERDWSLNDIRDIRVDYEQPIFDSDILSRQSEYYTDKILNASALDENKDWDELESLRDKYLVVRLIFDTFDDVKLIMNYSIENETDSLK